MRFLKLGNISRQSTSFSPKTRMTALNNDKAVWKISLQSFSFKLHFFFPFNLGNYLLQRCFQEHTQSLKYLKLN